MSTRGRTGRSDGSKVGVAGNCDRRGQANLLAVAVALVLVMSVLGASIAVAESVLVGATTQRDAADRHAAATLADRLVSQSPPSYPTGVIPNRTVVTATDVETLAPVVNDTAVSVALGGRTLFEQGDAGDGVTVYRGVLVATPETRQLRVNLSESEAMTLPHRTRRVALELHPGRNTTVHTVRVNDRIVLHNETGLSGTATVDTSRRRTTELRFETGVGTNGTDAVTPTQPAPAGTTPNGSVVITYTYLDSQPATLAVTVDV